MTEMELRSFEVRAEGDAEEMTLRGLAVPYGEAADIGGAYLERFERGAISSVEDVKIFYGHQHDDVPIGKVVEGRETEEGYEITAKLTRGIQKAEEVYLAMKDGVLNRLSVGFKPTLSERDGNTVVRKAVELLEVSVVPWPAFAGSVITEVRSDQDPELDAAETTTPTNESEFMDNMELDVRAVQDEVAEIRRIVEAGMAVSTPAPAVGAKFRSVGEFAKGMVTGDSDAVELARTASTSADAAVLPAWFGYINTLITNNRPTLSAFQRAALPASGLTVEYTKIDTNTLTVGEQDPENEALAFGNLSFDVESVDVLTYGGYTSFSKQFVQRAQVDTLSAVFEGLAIAYANATNAKVVSTLAALDWNGKTFTADGGTAASLATGIANGAAYIFQNSGLRPEFIVAAPNAYIAIVGVGAADGRPVNLLNGAGVNNIGSANIAGLSGQIFGLPIIVDPQLASGVAYLANSAALISMESAGAPVRLTDGDITTLTDTVSTYGYMAVAVPREGAIVKLDVID
jgi:HK97 family phage prohead protease/HK97 family phage major capsid protein